MTYTSKARLLLLGVILLTAGCAGSPEKGFVYTLDGVGQIACNRGAEKSELQLTVEGLEAAATIVSAVYSLGLARGAAPIKEQSSADDQHKMMQEKLNKLVKRDKRDKLDKLDAAFNYCKTLMQ